MISLLSLKKEDDNFIEAFFPIYSILKQSLNHFSCNFAFKMQNCKI
ncbi:unknown protein [Simkania negevensis Z]|uniref:Uncharacterized protein n=1 Tax=Simkania negevensis (strain ATCC VR-1471 / DSM 27360 / Z) TaxID=331113 RepID=F8L4B3_SIMNZ|nr:unknown protein [Simkania negevensis Z]